MSPTEPSNPIYLSVTHRKTMEDVKGRWRLARLCMTEAPRTANVAITGRFGYPSSVSELCPLQSRGFGALSRLPLVPTRNAQRRPSFDNDHVFLPSGTKRQVPPIDQLGLLLYPLAHSDGVRHLSFLFYVSSRSPFPSNLLAGKR